MSNWSVGRLPWWPQPSQSLYMPLLHRCTNAESNTCNCNFMEVLAVSTTIRGGTVLSLTTTRDKTVLLAIWCFKLSLAKSAPALSVIQSFGSQKHSLQRWLASQKCLIRLQGLACWWSYSSNVACKEVEIIEFPAIIWLLVYNSRNSASAGLCLSCSCQGCRLLRAAAQMKQLTCTKDQCARLALPFCTCKGRAICLVSSEMHCTQPHYENFKASGTTLAFIDCSCLHRSTRRYTSIVMPGPHIPLSSHDKGIPHRHHKSI